jgi:Ser/Thr protein kinase RdoA (MazF antagonist)
MPGAAHDPTSEVQIAEAGRALALFHAATEDFTPPVGKEWPRYHAPSLTIEALRWALEELAGRDQPTPAGRSPGSARAEVQRLLHTAEQLADSFTDADYASYEQLTVHGDWHPANVRYEGDRVCGIFDLDWATRQPRLVDIADGVMFFAGSRNSAVDATDIRSLTQPFELRPDRTRAFLEGYRSAKRLDTAELAALPRFMLARWLWCRADPMRRKIPRHEAIDYLLDGIWGPLDALRGADSGHIRFT